MSNKKSPGDSHESARANLSRRDFVALSAAAGLVAGAGMASAADVKVVETDVSIPTADGTCDAAFFHPATGTHPGVVIWTDIFGLRPSFREFGRRLAGEGYAVLVPNPFYRVGKAPFFTDLSAFNFQNPADRAKIAPLGTPLQAVGTIESDAKSYIGFLDSQPQVNKSKKIGTQGYCMGGPFVLRTAATVPDRVGAGASFHGGGLVTDKPDSPHLLASKIKAKLYIGIAGSDDKREPEDKGKLIQAFASANVPAEVVVYSNVQHGWCVPDMPTMEGHPIYDKAEADRAWGKLLSLYHSALA